jgi:hypothetical protein
MKKCTFCAEEIQDAAVVCKHCGRDLVGPAPAAKKGPRWGMIFLVVGLLGAIGLWILSSAASDQRMVAYRSRLAAWHQQCDAYVNVPNNRLDAKGTACLVEFSALQAYAKQQGWQ